MSETMVKEQPILMSSPMVKALLAGTKTQTRRVVKLPMRYTTEDVGTVVKLEGDDATWFARLAQYPGVGASFACPYGKPGDRLRVKEASWMWCERRPNGTTKAGRPKWHYVPLASAPIFYVADGHNPSTSIVSPETGNKWGWRFKVGRFMPRWASRITVEITEVRVQRLQEISEGDAKAEGCARCPSWLMRWFNSGEDELFDSGKLAYKALWESINGPGSWDANPWVWAVSFRRLGV